MWTLSNKRTRSHRSNAHSACPYPFESYLDYIALWPNHCSFPISFCPDAWYSPRELSLLTFLLDIDYGLRKPPEGWFPGLLRGLAWQIHPTNHGATTLATLRGSHLIYFYIGTDEMITHPSFSDEENTRWQSPNHKRPSHSLSCGIWTYSKQQASEDLDYFFFLFFPLRIKEFLFMVELTAETSKTANLLQITLAETSDSWTIHSKPRRDHQTRQR